MAPAIRRLALIAAALLPGAAAVHATPSPPATAGPAIPAPARDAVESPAGPAAPMVPGALLTGAPAHGTAAGPAGALPVERSGRPAGPRADAGSPAVPANRPPRPASAPAAALPPREATAWPRLVPAPKGALHPASPGPGISPAAPLALRI